MPPSGRLIVHIGGSCQRCEQASTCRHCSSGKFVVRPRAHDTHVFSTRGQRRCHCGEAYYDAETPRFSEAERHRVDL